MSENGMKTLTLADQIKTEMAAMEVLRADNTINFENYKKMMDDLLQKRKEVIAQEQSVQELISQQIQEDIKKQEQFDKDRKDSEAKLLYLQQELLIAQENHDVKKETLLKEQIKAEQAHQAELEKAEDEHYKKELKRARETQKQIQKDRFAANKEEIKQLTSGLTETLNFKENFKAVKAEWDSLGDPNQKGLSHDQKELLVTGAITALDSGVKALSNFAQKLDGTITAIANYKTVWDTRLIGMDTSYEDLTKLVKNSVGTSPFIKQEKVMQSLNVAIEKGISYNVEERAFLDTLSDSVATTFEAFDATLEEMVRIQQADSTAYRLGMEASLTEYLNSMFESTAYLNGVSDTVTKNLYQASSLLSAADSIGFEYQIQKWMGALYSVGMSSSAIGNISSTLGGMLSGDVSVLSNDSGRLLTMAASNTGNVDLATMLTDGLDSSELNDLMKSMVEYLQTIASDNKVVQNQYAKLFGLSVADIKAAGNLTSVVEEIYTSQSNYTSQNAQTMLNTMMTSISERVSAGAAMENLKDNFKYTLASGIASNPALYTTYALGSILNDTVGGIAIPAFSVMGNMVDLETTIADLMLAGSLGVSAMSGIGSMLSGLGQLASGDISGVFDKFHGESETQTRLGSSVQASLSQGGFNNKKGKSKSSRGASYVGNNSGDDYTNSNDAMVEDNKAQQASTVEETDDADTNDLYDNGLRIIELLESLVNHETSIRVISTVEESSHPFLSKYL